MTGLRLLMGLRPAWQLAIMFVYTFDTQVNWEKALFAIGGAVFLGSNLLLGSAWEDPRRKRVRKVALLVEGGTAVLLSVLLLYHWPFGPASLLMLPSLMTYVLEFGYDRVQKLLMVVLAAIALLSLRLAFSSSASAASAQHARLSLFLLEITYMIALGGGLLLSRVLYERRGQFDRYQHAMRQVEAQSMQLAEVNEQMNTYAGKIYELATAEERNRIAGEIHDTVAHRLTALLVQLQAARRLITINQDVQSASENMVVCEELARESLAEVRRSVRSIRRNSGHEGVELLRRLAVQYASLTGMEIETRLDPQIDALPAKVVAVLYRVLQEGLTNAQRHGRATRVEVVGSRVGMQIQLNITDNGKGAVKVVHGFGLSSMADRLAQLGGSLSTECTPGAGFNLLVKLPMWEADNQ
jgi:signal transduction histidine kinase